VTIVRYTNFDFIFQQYLQQLEQTLGVSKRASSDDIRKAYKKLAMRYHPDKSTEKDAEQKMMEITSAYEILSDDQKRREFDHTGSVSSDQERRQQQHNPYQHVCHSHVIICFFSSIAHHKLCPLNAFFIFEFSLIHFSEAVFISNNISPVKTLLPLHQYH
jgi:DnaJ-class molecular chaperone